ncbi:MAG: response regulator [Nitrospiraceae bacterium]
MSLLEFDHRELATVLLDRYPAKVFVLSRDGNLIYANHGFLQKYGRIAGTANGDGTTEPSLQLQGWWEHMRTLAARMAEGDFQEGMIEAQCLPDGTELAPAVMTFPVRHPAAPPLMGGLIVDYHPCRDQVGVCRQGSEWYRRLLELFPEAIVLVKKGRVVCANREAANLFGAASAEKLVGRSLWDFVHPDYDRSKLEHVRGSLERNGAIGGTIVKCLRLDGKGVDVELRAAPAGGTGDEVVQVLLHNLSKQQQLEEQVRQSQKMEAVGKLAGGIAHDFNNMLTVINGHGCLLAEDDTLTDDQRQSVDQILKAGERAAGLTSQLLAFSRRQVLQPKVIDVNTVLQGMIQMLRTLAGDNIELLVRPCSGLGTIRVDPGQLEQVILNLAVNARDAMPEGGRIIIEPGNIDLGPQEIGERQLDAVPGRYVQVVVADTGTGIDPAVLSHIFEPFFTTKPKGKGTGLGLSTVYGVVKQSGGLVTVTSERGRGTTFTMYFPRIEGAVTLEHSEDQDVAKQRGSESILVVEDEPAVRALVRDTLRSRGYRVLEANDGMEALLLVSQYRDAIDLLVTDIVMPQMGGRELAEHLLGQSPELRVMFMSGYTDDEILKHGVVAARVEFLQKPFTPHALANRVRKVLDQPKGMQPNLAAQVIETGS